MNDSNNSFSMIADSFAKHFNRIFYRCYPCDKNSSETLQEANLTTNILRALVEFDPNLFTWDEFPIPPETKANPGSKAKNRIDSVVIDSKEKVITMIESKCLGRCERRKTIPCQTIANDIGRMINVANHRGIFPERIWKNNVNDLKDEPIPLGNEYNDYLTNGIAACGVWWPGERQVCENIKGYFAHGIKCAMENIYSQRPDIKNKLEDEEIQVREIEIPNILLKGRRWQYFVVLYRFKIRKHPVDCSELNPCTYIGDLAHELEELPIIVQERTTYWYLYPACFTGKHVKGGRINNKLWIYKSDCSHRLFAYSRPKRTIKLPNGFMQNKKYVSIDIPQNSFVEDLAHIFAEIVNLNP